MVTLTLNGKKIEAAEGTSILQVVESYDIQIPTLCNHEALEPAGLCRLCTVEIFDGRRTRFVTSCNYPVRKHIEVETHSEEVIRHRKMLVELLLARCPNNDFVKELAAQFGVEVPRFKVDDDDCVLCGLCFRVCAVIGANAINFSGRGTEILVATPFKIESEVCVACGACAALCPTGHIKLEEVEDERFIKIKDCIIKRVKMERCAACGTPYAPEIFRKYVYNRIDKVGPPSEKRDVCPMCARRANAERIVLGAIEFSAV